MSIVSFFCHLFVFLIGILLSIPFIFLLIYIFTFNTSNEHLHQVKSLLFPSKQIKSDILTISTNEIPFHTVWMFGVIITDGKHSHRLKFQPIYIKLYYHYLFIHFPSKRLKHLSHINRNKIFFSQVIIFDLSLAKIHLKVSKQIRRQYWSNKTPIVINQLRFVVRYRIDKKKNNPQELMFTWLTNKDEIHLYALTMRSKEEWFYRFHNSIQLYSKSLIDQPSSNTTESFFSSINPLLDQIELDYIPQKYSLHIDTTNSLSTQIDNQSLFQIHNPSTHKTWRVLLKTIFERIHLFPTKHHSENLNNDYLCWINTIITRCTLNIYENSNVRKYFKDKIQHEFKHLKVPSYIQNIHISHFHFDNIYPQIENLKRIWFNHNGLWTAVDFIYQGNISIEFTIEIDFIREKKHVDQQENNYSMILKRLKQLFYFRENIQVLKKMINTILVITINIRSIKGILLINIPLPPSDRLWFGFEEMPLIDFDVHHRQVSPTKSSTMENYSNKELNQLQTTINHLLSQWIQKQIQKECVLPNMRDVCMKWCHNPLENDSLSLRIKSPRNHLQWFNQNDFEDEKYVNSSNRIYLIAQWKQKKVHRKCRTQKLVLPKRAFFTDSYLIYEHH